MMAGLEKVVLLALVCVLVCIALPFVVYFCVKFGTVAYYKAKEFVKKELEP